MAGKAILHEYKLTEEIEQEYLELFAEYIDQTDFPVIERFAVMIGIPSTTIKSFGERNQVDVLKERRVVINWFTLLRKCRDKATAYLAESLPTAKGSGVIFALKAMAGWRDHDPANYDNSTTINMFAKDLESLTDSQVEKAMHELLNSNRMDNTERPNG